MPNSHHRGHKIIIGCDGSWVFADTLTPTVGSDRPCGNCGQPQRDGHDPCLSNLPGVMNACCGHGVREDSYIQFTNGVIVRGFTIDD